MAPPTRILLAQSTALVGIAVALYAVYVEQELARSPDFVPACHGAFGGSCTTVLTSSYAHILSHWGLVPKGHTLDLSLATSGVLLYSAYVAALAVPRPFPLREAAFLGVASAGAAFSLYLLWVIKVVLQDFCVVCTSFHVCNFIMLVLAALEYRSPSVPWPRAGPARRKVA